MKNKILLIGLLCILVIISGCIEFEEEVTEEEIEEEENISEITENITEEAEEEIIEEEGLRIENIKLVSAGKNPALVNYNGTLYIFFERFTGESEDLYYKTFDGNEFSKSNLIVSTVKNNVQPNSVIYKNKLYLFWTEIATTPNPTAAVIYYKTFSGSSWGDAIRVDFFDLSSYNYNHSAVVYDNKIYLFYNKGTPSSAGKIYSITYDENLWLSGPKFSIVTSDDKNAVVTNYLNKIALIYESYTTPSTDSNDIYYRQYSDKWSSTLKLSIINKPTFKSVGEIGTFENKAYIIWIENQELVAKTFDGAEFSESITQLTDNNRMDEEPSLLEFDNKLYIAWTKYQENNAPFVYLGVLEE